MPSLSAVLLAGGQSRRMGRDKALLPLPGGEALWQRQLGVLEALRPKTIFWSGAPRPGLPAEIVPVTDAVPSAGPLAGVSACLDALTTDLLVVLAIDLPRMDAAYLKSLAKRCSPVRGVVPQRGEFFEPLAAVYPRVVADLAADRLRQGRYAMQDFVREALRRELVDIVPVSAKDEGKFANVNTPEDFQNL
ncbi:MAG: molybdenum cofactor guanylyltransferase, partial [Verrucomicrobiota bacterium]